MNILNNHSIKNHIVKSKFQLIIALLLAVLMITTRYNQIGWHILPDASVAVFFAGGFYLSKRAFPFFLLIAVIVDFLSITYGGVSGFCITAAYLILIFAYYLVWYLGGLYIKYYRQSSTTKAIYSLVILLLFALFGYEILASGSFYLISGYFSDQSIVEFFSREVKYFPIVVISFLGYITFFCLLHLLISQVIKFRSSDKVVREL